jgi:hypothetical protein
MAKKKTTKKRVKKKASRKSTNKPKKTSSVSVKITDLDKLVGKLKSNTCKTPQCGGCFYFLGALGAAIYYISTATSFWVGVLGVLKAIVWPAFLVFELMKYLGM